jgi:hypothetical protein
VIIFTVKFNQIARSTNIQNKLVYLSGTQYEYGIVFYGIWNKVYLMVSVTSFQGQDKKEIMPVQIMHQSGFANNIFYAPYFKLSGRGQNLGDGAELSDGNIFHHNLYADFNDLQYVKCLEGTSNANSIPLQFHF